MCATFYNLPKLPKANNRPNGQSSPNLVTLVVDPCINITFVTGSPQPEAYVLDCTLYIIFSNKLYLVSDT
jgi:hypothetical protein